MKPINKRGLAVIVRELLDKKPFKVLRQGFGSAFFT